MRINHNTLMLCDYIDLVCNGKVLDIPKSYFGEAYKSLDAQIKFELEGAAGLIRYFEIGEEFFKGLYQKSLLRRISKGPGIFSTDLYEAIYFWGEPEMRRWLEVLSEHGLREIKDKNDALKLLATAYLHITGSKNIESDILEMQLPKSGKEEEIKKRKGIIKILKSAYRA